MKASTLVGTGRDMKWKQDLVKCLTYQLKLKTGLEKNYAPSESTIKTAGKNLQPNNFKNFKFLKNLQQFPSQQAKERSGNNSLQRASEASGLKLVLHKV